MKNFPGIILAFFFFCMAGCKKESEKMEPADLTDQGKITSPEYENDLLFVNSSGFQVQTNEPATFSSDDTLITISSTGTISKIYSGEIAHFDIAWTDHPGKVTRIYALGASDDTYSQPYLSFHITEVKATDSYAAYRLGWQTLQKLPITGATYAIILRHGDASTGKDYNKNDLTAPADWWLSCDSALARQLNAQGIKRSTELGKIFTDLGLPMERVVSSEFCRAKTTAELINAGPVIATDPRLNHYNHNLTGISLFENMIAVMKEQPVDDKVTLIVAHHPMNETPVSGGYPGFPATVPFTWTGSYFIRISPDKIITYEGSVSWAMFKYYRDRKMNVL